MLKMSESARENIIQTIYRFYLEYLDDDELRVQSNEQDKRCQPPQPDLQAGMIMELQTYLEYNIMFYDHYPCLRILLPRSQDW